MTATARLERLKPILVCPRCRDALVFPDGDGRCEACRETYPVREGRIYFVDVPDHRDPLDRLKGRLKRWLGRYYHTVGITLLAPTYPFDYAGRIRRYLDPSRQVVVNVGCGNHRIDPDVIGLDLFAYEATDVVCDVHALPFRPDSVDAFVSRSVLEHVPDPAAVVAAFHRATRPGGLGLHLIPFLFPFHASPQDFQRYTHRGLERLFAGWTIIDMYNATGPVTLWLLTTLEFLSTLLSAGRERAKAYLYLALCGLLFPLKFLDAPFVHRRAFLSLAPTIFTVVRKETAP